jgi:hypothetical protein
MTRRTNGCAASDSTSSASTIRISCRAA